MRRAECVRRADPQEGRPVREVS